MAGLTYMMDTDKELTLDGYASQFDDHAASYTVMFGFRFGY